MSFGGGRPAGSEPAPASAISDARAVLGDISDLIDHGLRNYAIGRGYDPDTVSWAVKNSLERPGSTILEIGGRVGAEGSVTCYAKKFFVPPNRQGMAKRLRDRVERTAFVTERLLALGNTHDVGVGETLAFDVDTLALVSVGLDGDPLGKTLSHGLTPARRERARDIYEALGRSIRTIESVSADISPPSTYLSGERVDRALAIVSPHFSEGERRRVERVFTDLHNDYTADPGSSYFCHGDINHSNVLIDGDRINLIDFDMSSRPSTFDLSLFLMRMEMERPRLGSWSRRVGSWVVDGFGDEDATAAPAFHLVRLMKVSFGVRRNVAKGRRARTNRFLASLRRTVDSL